MPHDQGSRFAHYLPLPPTSPHFIMLPATFPSLPHLLTSSCFQLPSPPSHISLLRHASSNCAGTSIKTKEKSTKLYCTISVRRDFHQPRKSDPPCIHSRWRAEHSHLIDARYPCLTLDCLRKHISLNPQQSDHSLTFLASIASL